MFSTVAERVVSMARIFVTLCICEPLHDISLITLRTTTSNLSALRHPQRPSTSPTKGYVKDQTVEAVVHTPPSPWHRSRPDLWHWCRPQQHAAVTTANIDPAVRRVKRGRSDSRSRGRRWAGYRTGSGAVGTEEIGQVSEYGECRVHRLPCILALDINRMQGTTDMKCGGQGLGPVC